MVLVIFFLVMMSYFVFHEVIGIRTLYGAILYIAEVLGRECVLHMVTSNYLPWVVQVW